MGVFQKLYFKINVLHELHSFHVLKKIKRHKREKNHNPAPQQPCIHNSPTWCYITAAGGWQTPYGIY